MDFSNIIIQFLVVCIGSFIGPLLLQYFKNKKGYFKLVEDYEGYLEDKEKERVQN